MESIVLRIKSLGNDPSFQPVIDLAAIAVDETGKETAFFQSVIAQPRDVLGKIGEKALDALGLKMGDLEGAPFPEEVAKNLRGFLAAHEKADLNAFNLKRVRSFLEGEPWGVTGCWGLSLRELLWNEFGHIEFGVGRFTLYEVAAIFKIPIPIRAGALLDARITAQIFRKLLNKQAMISDVDFLWEAKHVTEDGL